MSTPVEVHDPVSRDSIFVDEAGTCTIWIEPGTERSTAGTFVDFSLVGVLNLIRVLAEAAEEMWAKEQRDKEEGLHR
jgi:hypothetical protein